jgi:TRAP-type C4-dicarboxylate transport system substrate-binding protein
MAGFNSMTIHCLIDCGQRQKSRVVLPDWALGLLRLTLCLMLVVYPSLPHAADPVRISVIGGLGGVRQFNDFEAPFWRETLPSRTGGRIQASVQPFDASGLRGQEMLQLMRLGVVPFGYILLSLVASEEPELGALDLPGLNPDLDTMVRTARAYQPYLVDMLRERYGIELLGLYVYPAQVLFCRNKFEGLADLKGRRIRTSSVAQSEFVTALEAIPVLTAFSEQVGALKNNVVDCAITGTLSGAQVGLPHVTGHVHDMAIGWGVGLFGANATNWRALDEGAQAAIREGIHELERLIWDAARVDTQRGLACSTGTVICHASGARFNMRRVGLTTRDKGHLASALLSRVLPAWVEACGSHCAQIWNRHLGEATQIRLSAPVGTDQPASASRLGSEAVTVRVPGGHP